MATIITIYVTVTVASVAIPGSRDGVHPPSRQMIGIGLLIAKRRGRQPWRFVRRAKAIAAGEPESRLLEWVARRLPTDATMIGWNVDHAMIPVLLDAAASSPPLVAHHFVGRLHSLLRRGAVDMSLAHGGAGAPPLAAIAADMAIYAPEWCEQATISAWSTGLIDQLRHDLADEALALWRVFVRSAGLAGINAEAATDEWIDKDRRPCRVVRARSARDDEQRKWRS